MNAERSRILLVYLSERIVYINRIEQRMKPYLLLFILILFSSGTHDKRLTSGKYDGGLHIAFNPETNFISEYFRHYSNPDPSIDTIKFPCIFYFEGRVFNDTAIINNYYPLNKEDDMVMGTCVLLSESNITMQLSEEPGGCTNVRSMTGDAIDFSLAEAHKWIEIRCIVSEKSYLHTEMKESSKGAAYGVMGDILYIEQLNGNFAYCKSYSQPVTQGWIKL